MTAPEPLSREARIERAEREVIRLTGSGPGGQLDRHFRMTVPAEPDRDSDLVLMDGLAAGREALDAARTPSQPDLREALGDGPWQQLSDAATPGPWAATTSPEFVTGHLRANGRNIADLRYRNGHADGALIVAAVNAVRAALSQPAPAGVREQITESELRQLHGDR